MKKAVLLLAYFAILFLPRPVFADWDHGHHRGDINRDQLGSPYWFSGQWWYGVHGEAGGWWWVVPDGGWHLYPAPIYPYPDPPFPIVAAPLEASPPPLVIATPY